MNKFKHDVRPQFPCSIDINPTAKCNLHCSFCWGPDHLLPDSLTTDDWKRVIRFFAEGGTTGVVFTGGEPLIRKDIGELLQFAKSQGMHVTLSTNTLLLSRRATEVLPFVDDIGIPLDGSTPEVNSRMRLGNRNAFISTINALELVRSNYPNIHMTIRTVVSKVNKDDVVNIGVLLERHIDHFDRWKLYQFTPISIGEGHREEHEIMLREFQDVITETQAKVSYPTKMVAYPSQAGVGRYVFVGPQGDVYGMVNGIRYLIAGNVLTSMKEEIIIRIQELVNPERNMLHAH